MAEPKVRFKRDDGSSYPDIQKVPFGDVVKPFTEKTKTENEDVLLSCAINGVFLNTELFGHQRGASNKGYKKIRRNTLILSAQNLHLGNANVNQRFDHGIISPAYNTYDIVGCDPDYMAQWVKRDATKRFFYNATTTGASQCRRNVDWNALYEQIFYLPCNEEQQKIADFLSSVDEVISASEEEVANLEMEKKAVMKKIFSQEVRFKKADGSDFPEWEEKPIRQFAKCVAGATPSTKVDDYWKDGTIPWMSSGEVNKRLIFDTDAKISQTGYDNTSTKMVPAETVVMALAGQGKTRGMVALTKIELCTNQSLCSIVTDGSVNSTYLYQFLITQYLNLRQVSSGDGKRGGLNLQLVGDYPVLLPHPDEQRLIADFLSDFDEAIAAAKKELELWKELKKGLLQQMFV